MIAEVVARDIYELNELIVSIGVVKEQVINLHRKKDGVLILYYWKDK